MLFILYQYFLLVISELNKTDWNGIRSILVFFVSRPALPRFYVQMPLIVFLCSRKKGSNFDFGMCPDHKWKNMLFIAFKLLKSWTWNVFIKNLVCSDFFLEFQGRGNSQFPGSHPVSLSRLNCIFFNHCYFVLFVMLCYMYYVEVLQFVKISTTWNKGASNC
jgi:hypothetical protein